MSTRYILLIFGAALLQACTSPPPPTNTEVVVDQAEAGRFVEVGDLAVETLTVRPGTAEMTRSIPGESHPAPDHFAVVSAPIGGRVARITAHEGEPVRRGQVLLELESIGYAEMVADYLEARADESFYRAQEDRMAMLVERNISPEASLERARAERARAEVRVSSTYGRLRALDVPAERIESLQVGTRDRPLLPVLSPISGVVDEHRIDLGTSVEPYQELLTLVDPRRVLVRAFADPEDLGQVGPGTPVRIGRRSGDQGMVSATVTSVSPALDKENRSLVLNILVDTEAGFPMPGQTVRILVSMPTSTTAISVPSDCLVFEGDQPSVFVQRSPSRFELVPVTVEGVTDSRAFLAGGILEGDVVAISEVFSLKALLRYGEYGED